MVKVLDRAAILSASDLVIEKVEVPEWGGAVYVKSLSGKERDEFEESMFEGKGTNRDVNFANLRARMVALSTCNEEGKRLFKNSDVDALGKKNARALDRVFTKARELSGMSEQDIEEMTKNSGKVQGDSTSD